MCLQVGGLHGNHTVIGGVALVEAVTGKLLPIGEDFFRSLPGNAAGNRPLDELRLVLDDFFLVLLGNCLAEVVRFGQGVACQLHHGAHQLFLVDGNAIRLTEDRLHGGMAVFHRFLAVHALDVGGNELHGTRAVECNHGDDVRQGVRLHLHQEAGHAGAFQLEDARRLPAPHQFVAVGVIQRDVAQVVAHPMAGVNQVAGTLHHRQGGQPEEIHLQETQPIEDCHFKLGHGLDGVVVRSAGGAVERDILHHRFIGNHHPGGMRPGMAHHAFHLAGGVDEGLHVIRRVIERLEIRDGFQRFLDADRLAGHVGQHLACLVHLRQGDVHHPAHIADGGAGAKRTKGNNLRHVVVAVSFGAVLHHVGAAVILEVQVNIRHGDAPRVEEALKD